jgi:energy-coupling factor transporter ATPase
MPLVRIEGLHYSYQAGTRQPVPALRGIDLTIPAGDYLAVVGANGSGKSTLLRHLNALLRPSSGRVWIDGFDTNDPAHLRAIRSTVGMVFQVPDSQIVATTVEEDVAFGPENLGVARDELVQRVDWALATVGLSDLRYRASHLLSAGQKQRLAIAGALAMRSRCILLDEATAMLDPRGRDQLLDTIARLHAEGLTIVTATHDMAEAARAQRMIVLSDGRIALEGAPRTVFQQVQTLRSLRLDLPPAMLLASTLTERVASFPAHALTVADLVEAIDSRLREPGKTGL